METEQTGDVKRRITAVEAMIISLAARFPLAFFVYERARRPLKLGVYYDLRARTGIPANALSGALHHYTRNEGYLRSTMQPGGCSHRPRWRAGQ